MNSPRNEGMTHLYLKRWKTIPMKKCSKSKKESEDPLQNKKDKTPRQSPRVTFKVVGQADGQKVQIALELLLTEWVRQARAEREKTS